MRLAGLRSRTESTSSLDVRSLGDEELDRLIRAGWEEWCELADGLVASGGMLPSRELARRVAVFFEDSYWRAEEARVEALRRRLEAERLRRRRGLSRDRGWGIT